MHPRLVAAAGAALIAASVLVAASPPPAARRTSSASPDPRVTIDLSGSGWILWHDAAARWQDDELFLPPADLATVPVHQPTGGWAVLDEVVSSARPPAGSIDGGAPPSSSARGSSAVAVSVPGTVEEYLHHGNGPEGDITGVSWWVRTFDMPTATGPLRYALQFESVRERAEVFVDGRLVGYDLVGSTPFEVDITSAVRPGVTHRLAVRITDPGGNFDWRDNASIPWGEYRVPGSHGFGGITGRVGLVARAPVYVDDVYVQNTPAVTTANAIVTVRNTSSTPVTRDVVAEVVEAGGPDEQAPARHVFRRALPGVRLAPGDTTVTVEMPVPEARPWSPESPALYKCEISLRDGDASTDFASRRFGFRWFAVDGIGTDALFRLNGTRIVLRSAINWGFWPVNGIYPTPEWARREIRAAKDLGLNMLTAHRTIPNPLMLEMADEMGLLTYEEPGAYVSGDVDLAFTQKLVREKLMRMVRRDRSHPSLVIRNMINEGWGSVAGMEKRPELWETRKRDLRDAHALDPSRIITHASAWAPGAGVEDPSKMHMRPFDDTLYMNGWYDVHHAEGPDTWNDGLYQSPDDFYLRVQNPGEIVFWGEDGAISTPSRVGSIKRELDALPRPGWDGAVYQQWFRTFDDFLTRKDLRSAFPDVDALTTAMAAISLEHQGRTIENVRIGNEGDGYVVNGWESQITENHSGIVDAFRHPKSDPALMRRYAQPLYVAVKLRSQVAPVGHDVVGDFYLVNERGLRGAHTLEVRSRDAAGGVLTQATFPVNATGGDRYGELLVEGVSVATGGRAGMARVEGRLLDSSGAERARGHEDVFTVDWRSADIPGDGAIWETGNPRVRGFLERQRGLRVPAYADRLGRLVWLVVARSPNEGVPGVVPADRLHRAGGAGPGLRATFYRGRNFETQVHQRTDPTVSLAHEEGATPDRAVPLTSGYSVRWEGEVVPVNTGTHGFVVEASGGIRLTVNGKLVIDSIAEWFPRVHQGVVDLVAGQPVSLLLEFSQRSGASRCRLLWSQPEKDVPDVARMLGRVARDGTTLVLIDRAETWMERIATAAGVTFGGTFKLGRNWLGGVHFVRDHPLFADLPVNVGMNWPYQAVVRDGQARFGLVLEGEQLVAGAWHSYPMQLGTAVGVIPHGAGRIIVSTLDLADNLNGADGPSHVARKLLTNFLRYATRSGSQ